MIGKIKQGMNFAGLVDYVNKGMQYAKLLASEGICTINRDTIIESFKNQWEDRNKTLSKPVGHISLSWHKKDSEELNDELMIKAAQDYMERMDIRNTQYMLIRHFDQEHPHLHIVYNRVDNNGCTISDSNEYYRNMAVCKAITKENAFYISEGKNNVKRDRLKGKTRVLYKNRDLILAEASKSRSWSEFSDRLNKLGIKVNFRYGMNNIGIVGVVFSTKEQSYGGAKLDKELKFQSLDSRFGGELASIAHKPVSINQPQASSIPDKFDATYIHYLPKARPSINSILKADSSEANGTEPTSSNNDNNTVDDFILIPFKAAIELILQPHQVQVGTGGGGGDIGGWRDKDKEDNNSNYRPRRGRR